MQHLDPIELGLQYASRPLHELGRCEPRFKLSDHDEGSTTACVQTENWRVVMIGASHIGLR